MQRTRAGYVATRSPERPPLGGAGGAGAREARGGTAAWLVRWRSRGIQSLHARAAINALHMVQLAPGELHARLFRFIAPGIEVDGGFTSLPLRAAGTTPRHRVTVTIPLSCPGRAYANGRPFGKGACLVWRPATEYDGISPAGYRWVTVLAGHEDLEEVGLARSVVHPWVWRESLLVSNGREADRRAALALLRRMEVWRGAGDTEVPAREAAALRTEWLSLAARVVAGARPWPRPRPHDWRAALDVRAVERHVRARLAEPIYLRDLRDATGIPERTMQDAFRTVLGMRPMAYIETLRLHALHADLLQNGPRAPRTVSEAARRNGIAHLSRLGGRYRAIFGENPSETMGRARERVGARTTEPSAP